MLKPLLSTKSKIIISALAIPLLVFILPYTVDIDNPYANRREHLGQNDVGQLLEVDSVNIESDYDAIYERIEQRKDQAKSDQEASQILGSQSNTTPNTNNNSDTPYYAYPEEILTCTRSGNDLLVLVNKKHKLPSTYAPSDLVSVTNSGIRTTKTGLYVRNIMINDLKDMNNALKQDGIDIAVLSAYRSYQTQQTTYNYWVSYNGGNTNAADQVSARPGHSQHQLGTAVDFTSSEIGDALGTQFVNTKASNWLKQNAWKYGFVLSFPSGWENETGFNYEPWHYRYIGRTNAQNWHNSGQILEIWLRSFN
jgi:LAS superfamily LD-carboxypeptidase LdcB